MLNNVTLFERLTHAAREGGPRTIKEDRAAIMRSVMVNLQRVLNSHQGDSAAQPDLGIPSPHELMRGYPATTDVALRAVKTCIQRFEPRLTNVLVSVDRSDEHRLAIGFSISAQLAGGDRRDPVKFFTVITPDGRMRMRDA